ncbi:DNA/RNA non-specific endonuclease [Pontibacter silvestris]|uniref:DNA/RNA non-specific endonuclease n=1 Tax=Pontibacter silvestris TaxID=2305183 RepID=A0ABW4X4W7_9BACT
MSRHRLVYFIFFTLLTFGCKQVAVTPHRSLGIFEQEHLILGNPSEATSDTINYNNFLMAKPQYVLSYSRDRGTPNWVSWHVNKDWLGSASRQNDFRADENLPTGWYRVNGSSYSRSGFDRGHNVPSADRTLSSEANSATFLMTNMVPQAPRNNQETWASLENYTRDLVEQGQEVYVIMGSYGAGGTGSNGTARTIDEGRVTVPSRIWKILLVLPEGQNDLSRVTVNTRVIAIDTPNMNTLNSNWRTYLTTVDAIEAVTGYDLLSSVPEDIQQVIEKRLDTVSTP